MRQIILDLGEWNLHFFRVPVRIFGYGLMLVFGFLLGIALAQWRARRAGEDPAAVSYCGILALIGGILGARLAYVIKEWTEFAGKGFAALLDFTSGGLIYYGGLALGIVMVVAYLFVARLPVRRYLDIVAASLMVGLAFGRAGCLLNGCCYGGRCQDHWLLGTQFPMFSQPLVKLDGRRNPYSQATTYPTPVYAHQMEGKRPLLQVDERLRLALMEEGELVFRGVRAPRYLHGRLTKSQLDVVFADEKRQGELFNALAGRNGRITRAQWDQALAKGDGLLRGSEHWDEADVKDRGWVTFDQVKSCFEARRRMLLLKFDRDSDGRLTGAEREAAEAYLRADELAMVAGCKTLPVQPAQALGIANALVLAGLLWCFHPMRRREGQGFGLLLVLYPITRFVEEAIRDDNPHDLAAGVLTHNQWTCVVLVAAGLVLLAILQRMSPSAGPFALQRMSGHGTDKNRTRHGARGSRNGT